MITRDRDFYKRFFTLTLTIALQNLITFSVNLADNVMIGAYSETALAGVALVNQIQFLLQMIVGGACEAVVILASRAWGRRDLSPVAGIANVGMRFSLSVATLLFAAAFFFPHFTLTLLTDDPAVISEGMLYLRIVCFSYFFYAASAILLASLRSVETVRIGLWVSLTALAVNVVLNWCLIYGRLGFPRLGVEGAAIATVTARIVELLVITVYCRFFDRRLNLRLRDFLRKTPLASVKSFFKIGWPMMASGSTWGIAMGYSRASSVIWGRLPLPQAPSPVRFFPWSPSLPTVPPTVPPSSSAKPSGKAVSPMSSPTLRPFSFSTSASVCVPA